MRELDEEKDELVKYQELDKERRSLEYNLLDHELNDTKNELVSVSLSLLLHSFTLDIIMFYQVNLNSLITK